MMTTRDTLTGYEMARTPMSAWMALANLSHGRTYNVRAGMVGTLGLSKATNLMVVRARAMEGR